MCLLCRKGSERGRASDGMNEGGRCEAQCKSMGEGDSCGTEGL